MSEPAKFLKARDSTRLAISPAVTITRRGRHHLSSKVRCTHPRRGTGQYSHDRLYVVQTAVRAVERCALMTTDPGDLLLDPTCGSGTTAYVAEQWGRRWITIDTSRVALALARQRLMGAKYPWYMLADTPEGHAKEQSLTGNT